MKWFDKWFYRQAKKAWDNRDRYENDEQPVSIGKLSMMGQTAMVERGRAEGEGRISFELSTAVGGKILNVRRYDERKDVHNTQTYVIPNGEDVGERVAKIINLEQFRN